MLLSASNGKQTIPSGKSGQKTFCSYMPLAESLGELNDYIPLIPTT